ncbi:MAG: YifB family Mg chelatase-like AAA ATPase [Gammaproteobacteria bacterium]|nr:YifB family Mg chelatase-like AAA ATPase [Gammaproteobacteria bacterium]
MDTTAYDTNQDGDGLAVVYSRAQVGIDAPLVTVEAHLGIGLPSLSIVGLPEAAVKESKDRVRAAVLNSRYDFPARRLTINLAPADLPKEGGRFDLPVAIGILAASGQVPLETLHRYEFLGELALGGQLRPVHAVLPAVLAARAAGRRLIVPAHNAAEAALVPDAHCLSASHLLEVCAHLQGTQALPEVSPATDVVEMFPPEDLRDVRGQHQAKRALEIAAAGGHSLLMSGPPGTGKSMLARRLVGLLPPLSEAEALEVAAIASIGGEPLDAPRWRQRRMRAPHHSSSAPALVGGGSNPKPGEISRAHNSVLFLDELPEFSRQVLETLREPLETGQVEISRAARHARFPARFQLIAAMNPCPCGYLGDTQHECRCTPDQIARYRGRISGPLLDRIDMLIEVPRVPQEQLRSGTAPDGEGSAAVRARVIAARDRQLRRAGQLNHALGSAGIDRDCALDERGHGLLDQAMERFGLSARSYHRILKVARTIADLAGAERISAVHLSEAIAYRRFERGGV